MKILKIKLLSLMLLGIFLTSCEKEIDKTYTGDLQVRILSSGADFYIQDKPEGYDILNIQVGLIGLSTKDVTVSFEVVTIDEIPAGEFAAVEGTDFELTGTLTIPKGEYTGNYVLRGKFAGVSDGTLKNVRLKLVSTDAVVAENYNQIQYRLRQYCPFVPANYEGTWNVNDVSQYDGAIPTYQVTLTHKGSNATAMVDTMIVNNLWEFGEDHIIIINHSNPAKFTFSLPEQELGYTHPTYGVMYIGERSLGETNSCDLLISTNYNVWVAAGFFDQVLSSEWTRASGGKSGAETKDVLTLKLQ